MKIIFKILKNNFKKILLLVCLTFTISIFTVPSIFFQFDIVNKYIKDLGFKLDNIQVSGNNSVLKADIINKVVFNNCDNLFCLDLKKSKLELEKNSWIKSVKLKYSLPSKLSIIIKEEKPIFILKDNEKITLLNAEGKKIQDLEIVSNNYKNLLILSGHGVENKILNLLNIFAISTSLSEEIKEATLISSRRWSLKHSANITIELPENNPDKAFYKIFELEKKYGFLNRRLKKVDLRASDRMIIQLKNISDLKENDI